MKRATPPWWLEFGLKYWQPLLAIGTVLVGVVVFLATLSPRLSATEKKNAEQDESLVDLKGIASRLDGYIQGQQQTNQLLQQMQQQAVPNAAPKASWWWEQDQDGNFYCTTGTESWWPDREGRCD